jgi:hypothetical protein
MSFFPKSRGSATAASNSSLPGRRPDRARRREPLIGRGVLEAAASVPLPGP